MNEGTHKPVGRGQLGALPAPAPGNLDRHLVNTGVKLAQVGRKMKSDREAEDEGIVDLADRLWGLSLC